MAGDAVAAASDGQLNPAVVGERHDPGHVSRVGDESDGGGMAVDAAVERGSGAVVITVGGRQDPAAEAGTERLCEGIDRGGNVGVHVADSTGGRPNGRQAERRTAAGRAAGPSRQGRHAIGRRADPPAEPPG